MADIGELVKLGDGRWARYQQCAVVPRPGAEASGMSVLVAVELDERTQRMLDAAEAAPGLSLDEAPATARDVRMTEPAFAAELVATMH